ncbi:MAG: polysaccharide pyruvyl transferase family protein [Rikenellaceae bacterium]|nr:polysaccharide pyruvyl transferase family protein [Rikenellaceae bacterium]
MNNKDVNTARPNRRPRVLVYGYLNVNLGDDLFFRILADRYPSVDFYVFTSLDYEQIVGRENLHVIRRNRLNRIFASHLPYQFWFGHFDAMVYIGGSIFMERGNSGACTTTRNLRKFHKAFPHIPIHIIGSNYGPEQTAEFRKEVQNIFEFAESVCMRDTFSYNLFASSPRISCAPDVVFSMSDAAPAATRESAATLSIIDLNYRPALARYTKQYEALMTRITEQHLERGERVRLVSFCRAEGDVRACERIVNQISHKNSSAVEIVSYDGNIDHLLECLRSASVLYATRFHATILGVLFRVPTVPVIYSDKTRHTLDDMGWTGATLDLRQPAPDVESLQPHIINAERLTELRKNAHNQFAWLDKTLLAL